MSRIKRYLNSISSSEFVRNATVLVMGTVLSMIIQFGSAPILTRLYSAAELGVFQIFISFYSVLLIVTTLRYELAIVTPEDDEGAIQITVLTALISILVSAILMLLLFFGHSLIQQFFHVQLGSWMYYLPPTLCVLGIYYSCNYWLNRKKKFLNLAINRVLQAVLATGLAILFAVKFKTQSGHQSAFLSGLSQYGLITSYLYAQTIALCLFLVYTIRDIIKIKPRLTIGALILTAKRYRNFPKYMMPAGVVNNFAAQIPVFLLSLFYGATYTGQYYLMNKVLATPITVISQAVADVFRQKASSTYACNGECASLYKSTIKGLALLSFIPFAVLMLCSQSFIPVIFGKGYSIAALYIVIMAPFYWVRFVASPMTFMTVIAKRQSFEMKWQITMMLFTGSAMALGQFLFNSHYMMLVLYALAFIIMYVVHIWYTYGMASGGANRPKLDLAMRVDFSKIKPTVAVVTLFVILYRVALDYSYVNYIFPLYGYKGFILSYDTISIILSYMMTLPIALLMPHRAKRPSDYILFLLIVISYFPMLTFYAFGAGDILYTFANMMFWLIVCVFVKFTPLIRIKKPNQRLARIIFWTIFIGLSAYAIAAIYYRFGFHLSLSISNVYSQRAIYKSAAIPLAGYVFPWLANVILPGVLIYTLLSRKYFVSVLVVIVQLLLFSVTGMKSMLFALPMVIFVVLLCKLKKPLVWISVGAIVGVVGCLMLYSFMDQIMPFSLFVRRVLILPAQISNYYYDLFQNNGPIFFSDSFLSGHIQYPYPLDPANLIGKIFYHVDTYANSGIVADGFMNIGFWGMGLWAILLGIILKLMDIVSREKPKEVALGCFTILTITITNSALITNIFTHGILMSLIFLYFIPDIKRSKGAKRTHATKHTEQESLCSNECS